MRPFARYLFPLLVVVSPFLTGCTPLPDLPRSSRLPPLPEKPVELPPDALRASPRRLVGRILSVDAKQGFAFVSLTSEPPAAALAEGAELLVRTDDLRDTARLRASRYVRGRTLGAQIIQGQPSPGDEVVLLLP